MSDELELVRAYRRYLEHLAGKHNQKSHGRRGGGLVTVERKQSGGGFSVPKPPSDGNKKIPKMFGFTPVEAKKQAQFMTTERMKRRSARKDEIKKLKAQIDAAPQKAKADLKKRIDQLREDDKADWKQHSEKIRELYKIYGDR